MRAHLSGDREVAITVSPSYYSQLLREYSYSSKDTTASEGVSSDWQTFLTASDAVGLGERASTRPALGLRGPSQNRDQAVQMLYRA
jgi:hypothetical protein